MTRLGLLFRWLFLAGIFHLVSSTWKKRRIISSPEALSGYPTKKYTWDQILNICFLAATFLFLANFVPNVWAPERAVRLHSKCSTLTAICREGTAFSDWPCDALGRLRIGDKIS